MSIQPKTRDSRQADADKGTYSIDCRKETQMSEREFKSKQSDRIPSCIEIGLQAGERGDFRTARQMFRAAVRHLAGTQDRRPRLIEIAIQTAHTYFHEACYDQAHAWYSKALHLSRALHGPNTLQAACLMSRLAEINVMQSSVHDFHNTFTNMERAYLLAKENDSGAFLLSLIDLSWALCVHGHTRQARTVNNFIAQIQLEGREF